MVNDISVSDIVSVFKINKYSFVLKTKEQLILPSYKGSMLRGGFGVTFRRICCHNKKLNVCDGCSNKQKCAYAYVFETSPFEGVEKLRNLSEIPRPFVIEPPLDSKTFYRSNEIINFQLIFIGDAIAYLPYFIFTFKELGEIGIGRNRGRYELCEVRGFDSEKIYDSGEQIISNTANMLNINDKVMPETADKGYISLSFLTPTRIKFRKDLIVKPAFHNIIRALLHRLSALAYFHCHTDLDIDYNGLIRHAETVTIKKANIQWVDWERYSTRQETRMKLGGFIGNITYEGDIAPFLPLLLLGEYTHIGKNCTFGLGKYEIVREF